jgi:hypothetical protein
MSHERSYAELIEALHAGADAVISSVDATLVEREFAATVTEYTDPNDFMAAVIGTDVEAKFIAAGLIESQTLGAPNALGTVLFCGVVLGQCESVQRNIQAWRDAQENDDAD